MQYSIVYSSRTGNTRRLAQALLEVLPAEGCLYQGPVGEQALAAERIYIGFWTDKGTCDGDTAEFLAGLTHQQVFLFGTAGFGGSPAYLESILNRVRELLPPGVRYLGGFMCQGEMPSAVRKRYEAMEDSPRRSAMLENFDRAVGHPDGEDINRLWAAVRAAE